MILILLVFSIMLIPVFVQAEEHPRIFTNKEVYYKDDYTISIQSEHLTPNRALNLFIHHPNGDILERFSIATNYNGEFTQFLYTDILYEKEDDGLLSLIDGNFTIIVIQKSVYMKQYFLVMIFFHQNPNQHLQQ